MSGGRPKGSGANDGYCVSGGRPMALVPVMVTIHVSGGTGASDVGHSGGRPEGTGASKGVVLESTGIIVNYYCDKPVNLFLQAIHLNSLIIINLYMSNHAILLDFYFLHHNTLSSLLHCPKPQDQITPYPVTIIIMYNV